jgi:hypothetical protein
MVMPLTPWLGESARAVWEHHERWDGGGYPAGLAGLDIALGARIVNVADTFDVMTSARSYKEPVSAAESRAELARCAGGQFDPEIVRAFLNISIGRLRMVMGPISWIAQVPLFPTSVLTGAVGGNAATFAAALAVVGVTTLGPLNLVDAATGEASVLRKTDNGYVTESLGLAAVVVPPGQTATTATTAPPAGDGPIVAQGSQFAESNFSMGPPPTTSSPSGTPAVLVTPTGVRVTPTVPVGTLPSTPVVTLPSSPVVTLPSVPGVTVPSGPGVTTPTVPVDDVVSPPPTTTAPRAPFVQLGAAAPFAVLASAAITSTGPTSITGHVGNTAAAITGVLTMHFGEIFEASPTTGAAAQAGAASAQVFLTNLTASPLPAVDLGGRTISPGVYAGGTIELTGTVTLDAGGDPNAVFVLKAASTLVTASSSRVVLVDGAEACNVFWQVGSSATFGTGTTFAGTVIANVSITATTGTTLNGRLLALNGAITLDSNTISVPACN